MTHLEYASGRGEIIFTPNHALGRSCHWPLLSCALDFYGSTELNAMLNPQSISERLRKLKTEMRELADFNLRYLLQKKPSASEEEIYYYRRSRLLEIKDEFEKMLKAFRYQ